jgi:hypothetical protein
VLLRRGGARSFEELLDGERPLDSMRATHKKPLSNASKEPYYYDWSVVGARILIAYLIVVDLSGLIA